jgi:hypothetical protein
MFTLITTFTINIKNMKYWIFGHTHEELEYEAHNVKCFCNPLGYSNESGNGQWVKIKQIEV